LQNLFGKLYFGKMKFTVSQELLAAALSITSRFTSSRAQLPVLGNILFDLKEGGLFLGATNLEMSLGYSIGAKVEQKGSVTIPSKVILDIISNLIKGNVEFDVEKETIHIKSEGFSSRVGGVNAVDFPDVPRSVGKKALELTTDQVANVVPKIVFAISTDETRPILTGVLVAGGKNGLVIVSTDGFRLSKFELKLKNTLDEFKAIIPRNAFSELGRISKDSDVKMSYLEDEKQVVFGMDKAVLSTRVIEGNFPDFEKIIPKSSSLILNVSKEDLLRSVKLASVFAREASNVLKFVISENTFKLFAESSQSGMQESVVAASIKMENTVELNEKKEFEIAFNYRFVEEFLNSIEGDNVEIGLSNPSAPGIFTDPEEKNFLHLIMPVKI